MGTYKVVECSVVTEDELERVINEWVDQGYVLDGIQFAMREASKRPAMAFILFTREEKKKEVKKADNVHRAIAKVIDLVIVAVVVSVVPSRLVGVLVGFFYIWFSDGFFGGQSIGKKMVGLRVLLTDSGVEGRPGTFRQSLIRNLPYAVVVGPGSIPIFGWFIIFPLGVVFLLVEAYFVYADDQGIRIGDIYAGTQVIDDALSSKS